MYRPGFKKLLTIALFLSIFAFSSSSIFAAPSFSLRPSRATFSGGDDFEMEILIDSDGEEIVKARAVIVYDPTYVQIVKAEQNNRLFQQFPEDELTTDNTNGVIMLTGFTQSGSGDLYITEGEPDVFGVVTFKPVWSGQVTYDFEFSGDDEPFNSVMIADGSPPQNILDDQPQSAVITLINVPREGTGDSGDLDELPVSGIFDNNRYIPGFIGILGGIMVFVGSGIVYQVGRRVNENRYRTIVEVDKDE